MTTTKTWNTMKTTCVIIIFLMTMNMTFARGKEETMSEKAEVLNIYTSRHYAVDDKIYQLFTEATGIEVNTVKGSANELVEQIKANSIVQADLFITVDVVNLIRASNDGVLVPINTTMLETLVPPHLMSEKKDWVGVSKRARVIVYDKENTPQFLPHTYDDLSSTDMKQGLLIRSSNNAYNQGLVASYLAHHGVDSTTAWINGLVGQMARSPKGNDRDQMKAIIAGEGQYAVVNTYYIHKLRASKDAFENLVGQRMEVIFPNQDTTGTHINISGIGLLKNAPHPHTAQKFIEFMLSDEIQTLIMEENGEYPASMTIEYSDFLKSLGGSFREDKIDPSKISEHMAQGITIMQEARWK